MRRHRRPRRRIVGEHDGSTAASVLSRASGCYDGKCAPRLQPGGACCRVLTARTSHARCQHIPSRPPELPLGAAFLRYYRQWNGQRIPRFSPRDAVCRYDRSEAVSKSLMGTVVLVRRGSGGVYLADRLVLASGRGVPTEFGGCDAANPHPHGTESSARGGRPAAPARGVGRARIVVLDQGPRRRGACGDAPPVHCPAFAGLTSRRAPGAHAGKGTRCPPTVLVIKFDDTFVIAWDALKGKALLLFRGPSATAAVPPRVTFLTGKARCHRPTPPSRRRPRSSVSCGRGSGSWRMIRGCAKRRGVRALHLARRSPPGSGRICILHHHASLDGRTDHSAQAVKGGRGLHVHAGDVAAWSLEEPASQRNIIRLRRS